MNQRLECREIQFGSEDYVQEIELRNRILRFPLGLNLKDENLEKEKLDFHLGAFSEGKLVGVLILTPLSAQILKMRQVAVDSAVQGMGIGRELVLFSEKFALRNGFSKFELHARQPAVSFYEKLGYSLVGGEFQEVGIPHRKMEKELSLG